MYIDKLIVISRMLYTFMPFPFAPHLYVCVYVMCPFEEEEAEALRKGWFCVNFAVICCGTGI